MKLIIHDLDTAAESAVLTPDHNTTVIRDNYTIKRCVGCFGCWVKQPGECFLKDEYSNMGRLIAESDEIIIISKCLYGSFSPFIRNILDRSLSYLLPFLGIYNNEMHHKPRYKKHHPRLNIFFYGNDITAAEKNTAKNLAAANAKNFHAKSTDVSFLTSPLMLKEITL